MATRLGTQVISSGPNPSVSQVSNPVASQGIKVTARDNALVVI